MKRTGLIAAAIALTLTAACNKDNTANKNANGSTVGTAGRTDNSVSSGDRDFVRDVAAMNMAEIELGRLASQRAAGNEVKQFAQMGDRPHAVGRETEAVRVAARHRGPRADRGQGS